MPNLLNGVPCDGIKWQGKDSVEFSLSCAYDEAASIRAPLVVTDGGETVASFEGMEPVGVWQSGESYRLRASRELSEASADAIHALEDNVGALSAKVTATDAKADEAKAAALTGTPAMREAMQLAISAADLAPEDYAGFADLYDPFDPEVKYKKGRMVTYDGGVYRCIKNNASTIGTTPDVDSEHWERIDVTADGVEVWDPEKTYHKGDTCVHGGVTYVCQKNNVVGVTPGTNDKYWIAE